MKDKQAILDELRKRAEKALRSDQSAHKKTSALLKMDELLHELQIFQIELEMQNDELYSLQVRIEEERQRFENLFNLAPVGCFILDGTATIVQCNEAALMLLDLPRTKITGRPIRQYIVPDDLPVFYSFLYKLIYSNAKQTCELKMENRISETIYVHLEGVTVWDTGAEARYYIAAFDTTTQKISRQRLLEMNERLNMALSTSAMGTLKINMNNGMIDLDSHAKHLLGAEVNFDGRFQSFLDMIDASDRAAVAGLLRFTGRPDETVRIEFRLPATGSQVRHIEIKGNIKYLAGNFSFIGVISDVTASHLLKKEAEELRANEQVKIMKAVIDAQEKERTRISNSLHDGLAQLLYAIQVNLQTETGSENPGPQKLDHAKKLISDAIRETRNISFELSPAILSEQGLETALRDMIHRIAYPGLSISCRLSGFRERLSIHSEIFIFRVVQELVNNILKHSKATKAVIQINYKNKVLRIRVADDGIGIAEKNYEKRGSGLYSVSNRVKVYNGTFDIGRGRHGGTEANIVVRDFF